MIFILGIDMTTRTKYKQGDVFNYWTLLFYDKPSGKWMAKCVCGKEKLVYSCHLASGKSISCSCIGKSTHKMTNTPEYKSWHGAKMRCTSPSNDRYASYGGRGISMCDTWLNSFEQFFKDMGNRPTGTSLDRINNDGNYSKENCRWATPKEQMRNRKVCEKYGESVTSIAEKCAIPVGRLQTRLSRGWSLKDATTVGLAQGKKGFNKNNVSKLSEDLNND
jgi:hypothetical protein